MKQRSPSSSKHSLGVGASDVELQIFPSTAQPPVIKLTAGTVEGATETPALVEDAGKSLEPRAEGEEAPPNSVTALQHWNKPVTNIWRVFGTFSNFFMAGMTDAALGALLPYLEEYYHLTYTVISLSFLSPAVGYSLASISNSRIHTLYGRRAIAIFGPGCHLLAFFIIAFHPPYPVIVIMFVFVGFGNGLMDAAWCTWIGSMANANRISGILQAFYSAGATISPVIATTMIVKAGLPWYKFYYLMSAGAAFELILTVWAFWHSTGAQFRLENPTEGSAKHGHTREAIGNKITWLTAMFLLGYTGSEVALGGWIVTFMIRVRNASSYSSGITATGFWGGMTAGRALLGFVTERFGERLSVIFYLVAAIALELCFWLIPQFIVSAVAVAFLGFFLGPLVPSAIVLAMKILPKHLHVGAMGFAASFGGMGGALLPFAVGAIAQAKGVGVLQPIILAVLVVLLALWLVLSRIPRRAETMV